MNPTAPEFAARSRKTALSQSGDLVDAMEQNDPNRGDSGCNGPSSDHSQEENMVISNQPAHKPNKPTDKNRQKSNLPACKITVPPRPVPVGQPIEPTSKYMAVLNSLCATVDELKRHGYRTTQYDDLELASMVICTLCHNRVKSKLCNYHIGELLPNGVYSCCQRDRRFPCGPHRPTVTKHGTILITPRIRRDLVFYPLVASPPTKNTTRQASTSTRRNRNELQRPRSVAPSPVPRAAVVLDCEMGVNAIGDQEVISICAVDYLTGEILLDTLVWPTSTKYMRSCNTYVTGIRLKDLHAARNEDRALVGREGVCAALARFCSASTILIGHGLKNDLRPLRLLHPRIIDTHIVEEVWRRGVTRQRDQAEAETRSGLADEAGLETAQKDDLPNGGTVDEASLHATVEKINLDGSPTNQQQDANADKPDYQVRRRFDWPNGRPFSLKYLAWERLGRQIQHRVHSSSEDTLATRDLLHWYMENVYLHDTRETC